MKEKETQFDKIRSRVKNNRILASLMALGMIIIAISTFTDAAKNLISLIVRDVRPNINGEWMADITYPWNKRNYVEIFRFDGQGNNLHGTASYLKKKQAILEGVIKEDRIEFKTKTIEYPPDWASNETKLATHRYSGRVVGNTINFVLETYGGFSSYPPFTFTANKKGNNAN